METETVVAIITAIITAIIGAIGGGTGISSLQKTKKVKVENKSLKERMSIVETTLQERTNQLEKLETKLDSSTKDIHTIIKDMENRINKKIDIGNREARESNQNSFDKLDSKMDDIQKIIIENFSKN